MAQERRDATETPAEGHVHDIAEAAKSGIDRAVDYRAVDYVVGMTERAAAYGKGAPDAVVELGERGPERVWADVRRVTREHPERALALAAPVGLAVGLLWRRDDA